MSTRSRVEYPPWVFDEETRELFYESISEFKQKYKYLDLSWKSTGIGAGIIQCFNLWIQACCKENVQNPAVYFRIQRARFKDVVKQLMISYVGEPPIAGDYYGKFIDQDMETWSTSIPTAVWTDIHMKMCLLVTFVNEFLRVCNVLFGDSNQTKVKCAMYLMGLLYQSVLKQTRHVDAIYALFNCKALSNEQVEYTIFVRGIRRPAMFPARPQMVATPEQQEYALKEVKSRILATLKRHTGFEFQDLHILQNAMLCYESGSCEIGTLVKGTEDMEGLWTHYENIFRRDFRVEWNDYTYGVGPNINLGNHAANIGFNMANNGFVPNPAAAAAGVAIGSAFTGEALGSAFSGMDFGSLFNGGQHKPERIQYNKKEYVVRIDKAIKKKYIMQGKKRVYLSEIRGKYRYVKDALTP